MNLLNTNVTFDVDCFQDYSHRLSDETEGYLKTEGKKGEIILILEWNNSEFYPEEKVATSGIEYGNS